MNKLLFNDFEPAFPLHHWNLSDDGSKLAESFVHGMSLRDYFAAKALPIVFEFIDHSDGPMLAQHAYEIADAMLKERAKA